MTCRFKGCTDSVIRHSILTHPSKFPNYICEPWQGVRLRLVSRPPQIRFKNSFTRQRASSQKPENAFEVLHLAREQLYAEADHRRPDASISLAKACLLIALEEEAAAHQEVLQDSHMSLTHLEALVDDVQPASVRDQPEPSDGAPREVGSASSWSLSRLAALADEVKACFVQQHICTQPSPSEAAGFKPEAGHSLIESTVEDKLSNTADQPVGKAVQTIAGAMHQYPMQIIAALNTVLFERHGYRRMQLHGNPRNAQLNNVLDYGSGTPVALAVLYIEVAQRAGYPMVGCPLEEQFLVWPQAHGLKASGADFVIDPYSQGALYSTAEVAELFGLEQAAASGLQPASKRQIIAALLAALRDAHWVTAVKCFPAPGLMQPISLDTAASGAVQPMHGHHIARALAAAEQRLFLLPHTWANHLEYVLLLYFASQHKKALEEMQQLRLTFRTIISPREQEQLGLVTTRIVCAQEEV